LAVFFGSVLEKEVSLIYIGLIGNIC